MKKGRENLYKGLGKLLNSEKKIAEILRKLLDFTLNLKKVYGKSVEFPNEFPERLKVKILEL